MSELQLHGRTRSNYFNAVKAVLREKAIPFNEVIEPVPPRAEYMQLSPMAKIPCLNTSAGPITETLVILDYLETRYPEPALQPKDVYQQAKQRELCKFLELYVEWVGRRGYGALRGEAVAEHTRTSIADDLNKALPALQQLVTFSPWIAGDEFTYADIFGYFMLVYARLSAQANADIDLFAALPGSREWFDRVAQRDSVQSVLADASG
ncbi:MAG: glutathione S-transferase family protein [Pseudomonadota bacterium]